MFQLLYLDQLTTSYDISVSSFIVAFNELQNIASRSLLCLEQALDLDLTFRDRDMALSLLNIKLF